MPKVRVKSLRSLASKCNPSILTGALTESADYIEELEKKLEAIEYEIDNSVMSTAVQNIIEIIKG